MRRVSALPPAWRPEDEALLARLRDEATLERVWRAVAGDARLPHPRAAGMIAALRARTDGAVAVEQAARGELAPILRLTSQPDPSTLTPALAHHLALFHEQVAAVLERSGDRARAASAEHPRLRSLAMWLWLAEESAYLQRVAASVTAGALAAPEVAKVAAEAPYDAIARLGARARAGARELSEPARVALVVLSRVSEAATQAGVSERVRKHAERAAARARGAAIDEAVGRIDQALEDAAARGASIEALAPLFADGAAVWRWSGSDEQVEHFLVERATPFCWERYREQRWSELRSLLRPLQEPVDHLAARIERDSTRLAYAAPCAQMFVFRAEVAQTFDGQVELAERAVALCSTHRNGRLVLADLLIERGLRVLDVAKPWATGDALAKAAKDVRRAAELFPQLKRLPEAKQRLKAMGRDIDEP